MSDHEPGVRCDTLETLVHDLNQPLTALTNFLAAAQIAVEQHAAAIAVADLIEAADAEAARARAIVRRLRDHLAA
uniref:hypothetical protein n=1 Tax=uncultured Sphingomonas sp. TaxID=158754 RepID=UPI0035CBA40E